MSLLTLDHISMWCRTGHRNASVALRDISLNVEPGELITVAGKRSSGRTTLLRIAAGVTPPTSGTARFAGIDLTQRTMLGKPSGIAYAITHFEPVIGRSVLEQVAAPLLCRGFSILRARTVAYRFLQRAEVADCAPLTAAELDYAETLRVSVARALVTAPSLLLVDQPDGDEPSECTDHELIKLLRSIAHHDAIAVMLTTDEGRGLAGADRALTLYRGRLRSMWPPRI
ncbi:MAG TPA: ATP-binding cassette domain-containing protein [Conexibacter sp.]|nr:ATP-binding cassette domain-containing protein [Conexibacter sp.]